MNQKLLDHMEKLPLFVSVAHAGSFRLAAKSIRLSQPTLSHSIQILESVLGTPLFHRSQKGVSCTTAGTQLLHFSERLISEVQTCEQRIRSPESVMSGQMEIGTYSSFISYLWPRFLKSLKNDFPDLSVRLTTLKKTDLNQALTSRKCHFTLSSEQVRLQDGVNVKIFDDELAFFHSAKHEPNSKDEPLIYVPEAKFGDGQTLEQILWEKRIRTEKSYKVESFDSAVSLALEGLGTAILPLRILQVRGLSTKLVRAKKPAISGSFAKHTVYVGFMAQDRSDERIQTVIKRLKAWASN